MVLCTEEAGQGEGTHPHPKISLFSFLPLPPLFHFFWLERQNVQGDSLGELMASPSLPSPFVFLKNPF